jgi:hypothetical protein
MAKKIINIGTDVNTKDGDTLRVAFQKVNDNFTELFSEIESLDLGEISWNNVLDKPTIPTDISQLTDNQGLLADSFDGGGAASDYNEEQTIDGGGA